MTFSKLVIHTALITAVLALAPQEPRADFFTIPISVAEVIPYEETDSFMQDLTCISTAVYQEARGESLDDKISVAWVILNRTRHPKYSSKVCDVVYEARTYVNWKGNTIPVKGGCAFAWWCDGKSFNDTPVVRNKIDRNNWSTSMSVSKNVLLGQVDDPTHGATHFWNHHISNPDWGYPVTIKYKNHTFAKRPHNI